MELFDYYFNNIYKYSTETYYLQLSSVKDVIQDSYLDTITPLLEYLFDNTEVIRCNINTLRDKDNIKEHSSFDAITTGNLYIDQDSEVIYKTSADRQKYILNVFDECINMLQVFNKGIIKQHKEYNNILIPKVNMKKYESDDFVYYTQDSTWLPYDISSYLSEVTGSLVGKYVSLNDIDNWGTNPIRFDPFSVNNPSVSIDSNGNVLFNTERSSSVTMNADGITFSIDTANNNLSSSLTALDPGIVISSNATINIIDDLNERINELSTPEIGSTRVDISTGNMEVYTSDGWVNMGRVFTHDRGDDTHGN